MNTEQPALANSRSAGLRAVGIRSAPVLLLLLFPTLYYAPALFDQQIQISGENVNLGHALFLYLARGLRGEHSLLWSDRIYGGHPLFAEGHGAFAHPLNLSIAAAFPNAWGYGLLQCANLCSCLLASTPCAVTTTAAP